MTEAARQQSPQSDWSQATKIFAIGGILAVVWMLGDARFTFDESSKAQIIAITGGAVAYLCGHSQGKKNNGGT